MTVLFREPKLIGRCVVFDLDEILTVRVHGAVEQKFILIRATHSGKSKLVLYGDAAALYHRDILAPFYKSGIETSVIGGGKIKVDTATKNVYLWDHSLEFGFPDWEECRALAAAEYPDHAIHVKTEPPKIAVGEKSRRKKVASKSKSTTKKKKRV